MEIIRNAIKTVLFLTFAFNASIWLFVIGYKLYMPKAQFQIPLKFTHEQQQISSTADLQSYSHYLSKWSTKYSVWIHLIVPDNQTNNSLGNFMVSLTGVQINESIPLIMCYKSFIVRTAKCLLKLPLFLVCGWQEEQHLKGCLVKDVKIQSRLLDITIFSDRLQIYHGYLEFGAKLSGIQQIYHRYFIPASLISIWFIFSYFVISSSVVGIVMYWKNYQTVEEPEDTLGLDTLFQ